MDFCFMAGMSCDIISRQMPRITQSTNVVLKAKATVRRVLTMQICGEVVAIVFKATSSLHPQNQEGLSAVARIQKTLIGTAIAS